DVPRSAAALDLDVGVGVVADELDSRTDAGLSLDLLDLAREVVIRPRQPVERHAADLNLCRAQPTRGGDPRGADRTRREETPACDRTFKLLHISSFGVDGPCLRPIRLARVAANVP